ncbi:MAG: dihydroneopterin aldolase [Bacteroidales bacterium]|nr:dihydroneopterin aldolase [Bacteroidales bacterium]
MSKISLQNMKFHAYHGCLDFEKRDGNTFLVSVEMELDTSFAEETDNLKDTLNYQEVYDVIKREMEIPSNLIEHVGRRILNAIKESFPEIKSLKVKLSKLNPPLGGDVESVSIELETEKQ